jgi:hypothetical protein
MSFDDSRIKHHPNKKLLADIRKYFRAFVNHDADASKAMQAEDYTMTNVGKPIPFLPLPSQLHVACPPKYLLIPISQPSASSAPTATPGTKSTRLSRK